MKNRSNKSETIWYYNCSKKPLGCPARAIVRMLEETVLTLWPYHQVMLKTTMVKNSKNLNYSGWVEERAMQPRV